MENVEYPAQYMQALLDKCQKRHVERTYDMRGWNTAEEFIDMMARKTGKLLKGGEVDEDTVTKSIVNDFLRGKIPWFVPPPKREGDEEALDGRKGRLGEMKGMKRKRDGEVEVPVEAEADVEEVDADAVNDDDEGDDSDESEEFGGFEGEGVVLPGALGNLDQFAEASEDEDEGSEVFGEEEDEAVGGAVVAAIVEEDAGEVDTPRKKRRKA